MKKILVSNECVACGICVSMSEFLEELPNGKVIPKASGTISDMEAESFAEVISACPVQAISLENSGLIKGNGTEAIADLKKLIKKKLENFKVQAPSRAKYRFKAKDFRAPTIYATGEYRYDYKSDSKAEQAGLKEFDQVMYSQKRAIIQQMLVEYKHSKLKPYNCFENEPGNFYFDIINEIKKELQMLMNEVRDKTNNQTQFPTGFEKVEPKIDFSDNGSIAVYQLRNLEKVNIVDQIANRLEPLYEYKLYVNTHDIDNGKRYMSCYDIREVIEKFGEDIAYNIEDVCDDLVEMNMENAIRDFNSALQKELDNKVEFLLRALDKVSSKQTNHHRLENKTGEMFCMDKRMQEIIAELKLKLKNGENLFIYKDVEHFLSCYQPDYMTDSNECIVFEEHTGCFYYVTMNDGEHAEIDIARVQEIMTQQAEIKYQSEMKKKAALEFLNS